MAGLFGDAISRYVTQSRVACSTGGYVALQVGSLPQSKRRYLEIQVKGKRGMALALKYVNANADGTFTTPTNNASNIKTSFIVAGGTYRVFPISDTVALYGRMLAKAGATEASVQVVVAEHI